MPELGNRTQPMPRILVVEDDTEFRMLLVDELLDEGYEVIEAVDGEDATLKTKQTQFDLIITDVRMPKVGGFELLSRVREVYPELPVILITAFGDSCIIQKASEMRATDCLCKPFKTEEMKIAVKRALNQQ